MCKGLGGLCFGPSKFTALGQAKETIDPVEPKLLFKFGFLAPAQLAAGARESAATETPQMLPTDRRNK